MEWRKAADGTLERQQPWGAAGEDGLVSAFALSPDGQWLAAGTTVGEIRLYPAREGEPVRVVPAGPEEINSLAFSPDGR